ncbi:MAG: amine dehydrogenase [Pseudomonadales bacterium]|nr:amine dehydrogenase [Pseudomonadales bacterium]
MVRLLILLGALAAALPGRAEIAIDPVGKVLSLPATYPSTWLMVHDFAFFHMMEGKILIVDPLAPTQAGQFKAMLGASFTADYARSRTRNEHYVVETFYSRGTRGGERTDVVTIYDTAELKVQGEIVIPPERLTGMPKPIATTLSADERLLYVYNFTPEQSVSVVDLVERRFVAKVSTPGCGFVVPTGRRSFFSICQNGALRTVHLDATGVEQGNERTEPLFDADLDPVFEGAAISGGVAYFPTFLGNMIPVDLSGESPKPGQPWSLGADGEWRPGGMRPVTTDAAGLGYVLMHADGAEGTHKDPGSEVWVYDLAKHQRLGRIALKSPGLVLGTTGDAGQRLLAVTNVSMAVDIYRLPDGEFVHTLAVQPETPFALHGAQ